MDGNTYKKKEYSLKSRIDLLEKINTKPYFILYDDLHTNSQSKLHTRCSEKKENLKKVWKSDQKNIKDIRKYVKI